MQDIEKYSAIASTQLKNHFKTEKTNKVEKGLIFYDTKLPHTLKMPKVLKDMQKMK